MTTSAHLPTMQTSKLTQIPTPYAVGAASLGGPGRSDNWTAAIMRRFGTQKQAGRDPPVLLYFTFLIYALINLRMLNTRIKAARTNMNAPPRGQPARRGGRARALARSCFCWPRRSPPAPAPGSSQRGIPLILSPFAFSRPR